MALALKEGDREIKRKEEFPRRKTPSKREGKGKKRDLPVKATTVNAAAHPQKLQRICTVPEIYGDLGGGGRHSQRGDKKPTRTFSATRIMGRIFQGGFQGGSPLLNCQKGWCLFSFTGGKQRRFN